MPETFRLIRSSRRRRTVALHVARDGILTIQAPVRTSLKWIESFVASRAAWIADRRAEATRKGPIVLPQENDLIPVGGETLRLVIRRGAYEPARREEGSLILSLAPTLNPADLAAEAGVEIALWAKKHARRVFQERLSLWAERMEQKPRRLVLCAPKRQWGSCTHDNQIRLNWHLIFAAPALLDYVIVHELSHIPHKNHGAAFWRHVARFIPAWKSLRVQLRAWEAPAWLFQEPAA